MSRARRGGSLAAAAVLIVALALAAGAGLGKRSAASDPVPAGRAAQGEHGDHGGAPKPTETDGRKRSAGGYTLVDRRTSFRSGRRGTLAFVIRDKRGAAVRRFDVEQDKRMHVVIVRRDFAAYQHVHPELARSGAWSTPLALSEPGPYRLFADFTISGERYVLGADLEAVGPYRPRPFPAPAEATSVDGYDVAIAASGLSARAASQIRLTITKGGLAVTNLGRYLGAKGHLVVLRRRDMSYLHVHPSAAGTDPNVVEFAFDLPSAGAYAAFFQFRVGGRVRTAPFTFGAS